MRQTSYEAFKQIESEGLLSKLRFVVYKALYEGGPMTAQETWHYLRDQAARRGEARINGITPRFSELFRCGVIEEDGERPCKITKRKCIVWKVNAKLPVKLERPHRRKCKACDGKGYLETQQTKIF